MAKKNKVEILVMLNDQDQVEIAATTKNIVTALGMLAVAMEIIKAMSGGKAEEKEPPRILTPEKRF
jgi:hypothetical protein